jgi:predicted  nucleic acid-binding Zn-ribbon protein
VDISLTNDQYAQYDEFRKKIVSLKSNRSDLYDVIYETQKNLEVLNKSFVSLQSEVDEAQKNFQDFINEFTEQYGISDKRFVISDEEPHTITFV